MGKKAPNKVPNKATLVTAVCIFMLLGFVGNTTNSNAIAACQQQCDGSCSQTTQVTNCGCSQRNCGCKKQRCCRAQKCPKCQNDFCQLERKIGKEKRTCYKTEQKLVCIPAVRLPWQKCQPMCSKTRVVNVLKKHKYECPKCEYKWSEYKPEIQQPQQNQESQNEQPPFVEQRAPNDSQAPQVLEGQQLDGQPIQGQPLEAQPFQTQQYDYDALPQSNRRTPIKQEVFDPTGGDVPKPPALQLPLKK